MNKCAYQRPNKPLFISVQKRLRSVEIETPSVDVLSVHASTECHVTPLDVADKMAEYLNLDDGLSVLDPQVGTGNLARACFNIGYNIQLTAIERNFALYEVATRNMKGFNAEVINRCFLEYAAHPRKKFDRVITNPPFSQVKKHMKAALDLLANNGEMIALVPVTFNMPGAELLEHLSNDCFALAKVNTKLIRITKN